jgi:hypothetical protein
MELIPVLTFNHSAPLTQLPSLLTSKVLVFHQQSTLILFTCLDTFHQTLLFVQHQPTESASCPYHARATLHLRATISCSTSHLVRQSTCVFRLQHSQQTSKYQAALLNATSMSPTSTLRKLNRTMWSLVACSSKRCSVFSLTTMPTQATWTKLPRSIWDSTVSIMDMWVTRS